MGNNYVTLQLGGWEWIRANCLHIFSRRWRQVRPKAAKGFFRQNWTVSVSVCLQNRIQTFYGSFRNFYVWKFYVWTSVHAWSSVLIKNNTVLSLWNYYKVHRSLHVQFKKKDSSKLFLCKQEKLAKFDFQ